MLYDCIIIGAGAAGLFCAASAKPGQNSLILEKTGRPGTKLLMSGSGQCNITHSGSIKSFPAFYGKNGGSIRSILYRHSNTELQKFFEGCNVPLTIREDGKVFPASMNARNILEVLVSKAQSNGFEFKFNRNVTAITHSDGIWDVKCETGEAYRAKYVILASGGCSYPSTGSDGSLFAVLKRDLSIDIVPPKPALCSITPENYRYGELAGVSFESARVYSEDGRRISSVGGLLFTHRDLSGPAILNVSKYFSAGDTFKINYVYPETYDSIIERLKKASSNTRAPLYSIASKELGLPKRFCRLIYDDTGESIKSFARRLTSDSFVYARDSGFKTAMATAGGVSLSEINTKTMEAKRHKGLFFIGEMCDIDGETGGYNLQFAYSSARAAGDRIDEIESNR